MGTGPIENTSGNFGEVSTNEPKSTEIAGESNALVRAVQKLGTSGPYSGPSIEVGYSKAPENMAPLSQTVTEIKHALDSRTKGTDTLGQNILNRRD